MVLFLWRSTIDNAIKMVVANKVDRVRPGPHACCRNHAHQGHLLRMGSMACCHSTVVPTQCAARSGVEDDVPASNLCVVPQESDREVTTEEGQNFGKAHGCLFVETSAKADVAVTQAFEELVLKVPPPSHTHRHIYAGLQTACPSF